MIKVVILWVCQEKFMCIECWNDSIWKVVLLVKPLQVKGDRLNKDKSPKNDIEPKSMESKILFDNSENCLELTS